MKQHITVNQLNELKKPQQAILREWLLKRKYLKPFEKFKMTIGQMIEFLDENAEIKEFNYQDTAWTINFCPIPVRNNKFKIVGNAILCDALWQATKEVLEK